jgi:hypothetical protein
VCSLMEWMAIQSTIGGHRVQLPMRAMSECLLLSASGWPIDVTEDERMTQAFNDCLTETFRRIELYHSEQRATTAMPQPPPSPFSLQYSVTMPAMATPITGFASRVFVFIDGHARTIHCYKNTITIWPMLNKGA